MKNVNNLWTKKVNIMQHAALCGRKKKTEIGQRISKNSSSIFIDQIH